MKTHPTGLSACRVCFHVEGDRFWRTIFRRAGLQARYFHRFAFPQGSGNIQHPLIPGTAEGEHEGLFREEKRAVNQNVGFFQQFPPGVVLIRTLQQTLKGVAGEGDHVLSQRVDAPGQRGAGGGLRERVAAGQGDPLEHRVFPEFRDKVIDSAVVAAGRVVGAGIMTAGTVVGAALGEHHKTDARAVHNGFADYPGEPKGFGKLSGHMERLLSFPILRKTFPAQNLFSERQAGRGDAPRRPACLCKY